MENYHKLRNPGRLFVCNVLKKGDLDDHFWQPCLQVFDSGFRASVCAPGEYHVAVIGCSFYEDR